MCYIIDYYTLYIVLTMCQALLEMHFVSSSNPQLQGQFDYYLHFTDKKTEVQRG